MRKIGYARVSTSNQSLDRQIGALRAERCHEIYREKASAKAVKVRSQLEKAIDAVGTGDVNGPSYPVDEVAMILASCASSIMSVSLRGNVLAGATGIVRGPLRERARPSGVGRARTRARRQTRHKSDHSGALRRPRKPGSLFSMTSWRSSSNTLTTGGERSRKDGTRTKADARSNAGSGSTAGARA